MKKILIFLILIMIGCSSRNVQYYYIHAPGNGGIPLKEISVYVDKEFRGADRIEIQRAIEQWNFALNGFVRMTVVDWDYTGLGSDNKLSWFIFRSHSLKPSRPGHPVRPDDPPKEKVLAYCDQVGGRYMYLLRDRIENEDMKGIMMHEMGHLLGIEHTGRHLMYYQFRRGIYNCIDYASIISVAKSQDLDVGLLNYCVYEAGH